MRKRNLLIQQTDYWKMYGEPTKDYNMKYDKIYAVDKRSNKDYEMEDSNLKYSDSTDAIDGAPMEDYNQNYNNKIDAMEEEPKEDSNLKYHAKVYAIHGMPNKDLNLRYDTMDIKPKQHDIFCAMDITNKDNNLKYDKIYGMDGEPNNNKDSSNQKYNDSTDGVDGAPKEDFNFKCNNKIDAMDGKHNKNSNLKYNGQKYAIGMTIVWTSTMVYQYVIKASPLSSSLNGAIKTITTPKVPEEERTDAAGSGNFSMVKEGNKGKYHVLDGNEITEHIKGMEFNFILDILNIHQAKCVDEPEYHGSSCYFYSIENILRGGRYKPLPNMDFTIKNTKSVTYARIAVEKPRREKFLFNPFCKIKQKVYPVNKWSFKMTIHIQLRWLLLLAALLVSKLVIIMTQSVIVVLICRT